MAPEKPQASSEGTDEADLAKAFQELAKGERTATALENQLSSMEAKIEMLLAQAEKDQQDVGEVKQGEAGSSEKSQETQKKE
ncbi:hypothetical protein MBLNU230_g6141t1 [Neophaeotheca triangularis]